MTEEVFSLFDDKLQHIVKKRFDSPTPIQQAVIPHVLSGRNALIISETGSGKTESALLPLFDLWMERDHPPISILYVTPLRSLNRDLHKRILWWSKELDLDVSVRHGDTSPYERKMQVENPPDMLIVTPETLQAILTAKRFRESLKNIRYIVLDEVHELVSNKRGLQLTLALERLNALIKEGGGPAPQMLGLSATVGTPEKVLAFFRMGSEPSQIINTVSSKDIAITVESPRPLAGDAVTARQIYTGPETAARLRRIRELIRGRRSVLAFTNTREFSEVLSSRLKAADPDLPVETHHSSLSRDVRIEAEQRFKEQSVKALICTSSLELGIDIGSIDFVIQYQSPRQVAKLLQRIGRAGHRLHTVSEGIILSTDADDAFESSVIARLALQGWVEPTTTYPAAWDVLAHQIIGLALERYRPTLQSLYDIVTRASPYREITEAEFFAVCRLLERLRLVWINASDRAATAGLGDYTIRLRKAAWTYYFENLTTIPGIQNYQIINIVTNKPVGTLDAEFVALHGDPGTAFICKGQAWRIVQHAGKKLFVEPLSGLEAAIPAWEGELIPVSFDVAQGVGRLRGEVRDLLTQKKGAGALQRQYPITRDVADKIVQTITKQAKWGMVPTERELLLEHTAIDGEVLVVLHACFGSLVNDTLGRVLATTLMKRLGSVGLQTDPYRIMFRMQSGSGQEVLDALHALAPARLEGIMKESVIDTELFRWKFLHVARRLGIIRKDAEYRQAYLRKIIENYAGTPAFAEALNEVIHEKLDIGKTRELLQDLKTQKYAITVKQGLSPLGELGIQRRYEIIAPRAPEGEIFKAFTERIMDTAIGLLCTNCSQIVTARTLRDIPEGIACKKCTSKMVGYVPYKYIYDAEKLMKKHLAGKRLTAEEKKYVTWIQNSASLIVSRGKDALYALAGRGIGPRTAGRILQKGTTGDELFRDILDAERKYIQTKKYWSR